MMKRLFLIWFSAFSLLGVYSLPATALSPRFERARQQNINKLSPRFETARQQTLNKLSPRFEEARRRILNK